MDFDNRKVYGDTFISDGLVYIYGVIVNYLEYLTMMVDDELGVHQDDDDKDS